MGKERLEEIKSNWSNVEWGIDKGDINWLIEQAERVQELEDVIKSNLKDYKIMQEVIFKEEQQNKRYLFTINAMQQILKDARHSLDTGEKVQGLEYGIGMADAVLEESE